MKTVVQWWRKRSSLEVSQEDKALVAAAYLMQQEKVKCARLAKDMQEGILKQEEDRCLSKLKELVRHRVSPSWWVLMQERGAYDFVVALLALEKKWFSLQAAQGAQIYRAMRRILDIHNLKLEMQHNLDTEMYYCLMHHLTALRDVTGSLYVRIEALLQRSYNKLHEILHDHPQLDQEELVVKISQEIGLVLVNEIGQLMQDVKEPSPVHVGIDVEEKEIMATAHRFQELAQLLEGNNLRAYIARFKCRT